MYIDDNYEDFIVEDEKIGRRDKAPRQKTYKKQRKQDYRKEKQYKKKTQIEFENEQ